MSVLLDHQWIISGLLLFGNVAGAVAVAIGIVMETPENPTRRQKIANKLVIWGVIAETLFAVGLFAYDATVQNAQGFEITSLSSVAEKAKGDAERASFVARNAAIDAKNVSHIADISLSNAKDALDRLPDIEKRIGNAEKSVSKIQPLANRTKGLETRQTEVSGLVAIALDAMRPRQPSLYWSDWKPYAPITADVMIEPGVWDGDFPSSLVESLIAGGWKVQLVPYDHVPAFDVSIEYAPSPAFPFSRTAAEDAASLLCEKLNSQKVFAQPTTRWVSDRTLDGRAPVPKDGLLIRIGPKSNLLNTPSPNATLLRNDDPKHPFWWCNSGPGHADR